MDGPMSDKPEKLDDEQMDGAPAEEPKPKKKRKSTRKAPKKKEAEPLYQTKSWKNVKTVHICAKCDHQSNDKDSMILHVVDHLPPEERETALEKLLKEQNNG
jgi:hypothetical protein